MTGCCFCDRAWVELPPEELPLAGCSELVPWGPKTTPRDVAHAHCAGIMDYGGCPACGGYY